MRLRKVSRQHCRVRNVTYAKDKV